MADIKFSIIIPVYNNTTTIERCLDSVCSQKYNNFEVILINDGSDVSYDYLKEKYENLIMCELPENKGQSYSRQYALDNVATGDWIMFVDADDELNNGMVLSNIRRYINRHPKDVIIKTNHIYDEHSPAHLHWYPLAYPLYGIVYNKNFIKNNNIKFDETLRLYEDIHFNLQCEYIIRDLYQGKGISENDQVTYKRHIDQCSLTAQKTNKLDVFLENTLTYELNMMNGIYDKFYHIMSDDEKRVLFSIAFIHSTYVYTGINTDRYDRIMSFMPKLSSLITNCSDEFKLNGIEKLMEFLNFESFNDDIKDFVKMTLRDRLNIYDILNSYNDFIKFFNDVFSIYLCYTNNVPYKKEIYDTSLPLLSIVIPVYNSKKVIKNTLDTLYTNLDMDYCEVIVVDDCSPDGDYTYLESEYKNLKVYKNICNKGYANSRQIGVDNAKGIWLIFLDHDDEISKELIPDLLSLEKEPLPYQELVYSCYYGRTETRKQMVTHEELNMVHGTVFNLNFIKHHNIRYLSQLNSFEDAYIHRTVHHILSNTYPFLIRRKPELVVYDWKFSETSMSNRGENKRTWMENHYGQGLKSRILALNFCKDIMDETYRIRELMYMLYEAVTTCDIYESMSENFRYELRDELPMIAAELYIHGLRYDNLNQYTEIYKRDAISGVQRALASQFSNQFNADVDFDNIWAYVNHPKYISDMFTVNEDLTVYVKRKAIWAFQQYFTHRIYYKSYDKVYAIDSHELKTVDPFSISYISKDDLKDICLKHDGMTLFLYAIKSKDEFDYIYSNIEYIRKNLNEMDIKFFICDDLYWTCDKEKRKSMKDLYTVNNYDSNDTLSMNQDFRYLMLTSFIHSRIFHEINEKYR